MNLFSLVVRRPVAVWMIAIAACVFGLVSYGRLPLDLMPDLAYPTITVRTEAEGYAPEEVETQVSRPVEEALATTVGLVELESRSRAGMSDVVLEFTWGTDMDRAAQDVRERLQTTFLPEDVGRPLILRYDPSLEPILRISLATEVAAGAARAGPEAEERALIELREFAERELKRELEAMDGVAAVRVRGGLEREVRVEARQDWMAARGISLDQLQAALAAENINLPGGAIRDGDQEFLVRTLGELRTVEEIRALRVRRPDGSGVAVGELAIVEEQPREREVESRLDGQPAVTLEVFKTADANIVRVARAVKERLEEEALPPGVRRAVLEDQAGFIELSLENLRSTALLGALLAVGILFLFLRDLRATIIIGLAIPFSIVVSFAPMYLFGVSLNLMSLGGLALGIGMLIDNAVVVLENIQNKVDEGLDRLRAAEEGAAEMAAAVTASTLTTVCVFLPITFVEGIAGQVFGDLSLAVVMSLLASLVVALFFVPVLAAAELRLPRPEERGALREINASLRFRSLGQLREGLAGAAGARRLLLLPPLLLRFLVRLGFELLGAAISLPAALVGRLLFRVGGGLLPRLARPIDGLAARFQRSWSALAAAYAGRLGGLLARPGLVLGLAGIAVALALPLSGALGQALIPEVHQGRFTVELALPVGTPLPRTSAFSREVEAAVAGLPDVASVHAVVGSEQRADAASDQGEHSARLAVELVPGGDLRAREERAMERAREAVLDLARAHRVPLDLRLARPGIFSFRTPIEVVVYDRDLLLLARGAERVRERLSGMPGLTDVESSLLPGYPEVRIRYDRDLLERFGLDSATVARRVRDMVQGARATTLSRGTGRVDLRVRLLEDERRGLEELARVNVNPALVPAIPLEAVARFEQAVGPSEIRRIDQRRAALISANLEGFDLSGQARHIEAALGELGLPPGSWEIAGQNREMERSLGSLGLALGLAVFLVYVIMASTFESVLHPFVILFSVPLALVGVVVVLLLTRTPVSVVVLIGAIVLAGVVVNNAIVLVDTINRKRAQGMDRRAAIQAAASLRLRPIAITTLTTVLGLVPLALGIGEGAEIQAPLAITVIAGLSSSTLLTLVVIPVVYEQLTRRLERAREIAAP